MEGSQMLKALFEERWEPLGPARDVKWVHNSIRVANIRQKAELEAAW